MKRKERLAAAEAVERYAVCIKCGHIEPYWATMLMAGDLACPACHQPKQFGPTVYIEGFTGYTKDEALRMRAEKKTLAECVADNIRAMVPRPL